MPSFGPARFRRRLGPLLASALLTAALVCPPGRVSALEGTAGWVVAVDPAPGSTVIGKRPPVRIELDRALPEGALVVMLDGTDVTQLIKMTGKVFTYEPAMDLQPGRHVLQLAAALPDGGRLSGESDFTSRHSRAFERVQAGANLSLSGESKLKRKENPPGAVDRTAEGNVQPSFSVTRRGWEFGGNGNFRYTGQKVVDAGDAGPRDPDIPPPDKLNMINYLLQLKYSGGDFAFNTDLGHVDLNETQNTVWGLSRRGGRLTFRYKDYSLGLFDVRNENQWGFREGLGLGAKEETFVWGATAGAKFLSQRMEVKGVWASGGDPGSSQGIYAAGGGREGSVFGLAVLTDFFGGKFRTEMEADASSFDADNADDLSAKTDRAYRLKAGGSAGVYSYEAAWERFGPDYASIACPFLTGDREGLTGALNASLGAHGLSLNLSRYHDNVGLDPLFPRVVSFQGGLDYAYSGLSWLPLGLNIQRSYQRSQDEPEGSFPMDTVTDTVAGRANLIRGQFNLGLQLSLGRMDDRTETDADIRTTTFNLSPAYGTSWLSLSPGFSLNHSRNAAGVSSDEYLLSLNANSRFLEDRITFDLSGSWGISKSSDDMVDGRRFSANARAAYTWKYASFQPSLGLRGEYSRNWDDVNPDAESKNYSVFLVFSLAVPVTY